MFLSHLNIQNNKMDHQNISSEVSFTHHHSDAEFKKRVRKTTIILSIITIVELGMGLFMYAAHPGSFITLLLKGIIVILTLAKAFYIVSVFMHLGDEIRNMIMTIVVPLMLFVWFIGAFLWDGNSYRTMRNRYDPSMENKTMQPTPVKKDTSVRPLH
jgi:cytochrome c oxidase subunit IV